MIKLVAILAGLIAVAAAAHLFDGVDRTALQEWESYKAKYDKHYNSEEEEKFRMKIFMDKLITIERHNERYANGEVGYTMGVNQFSDMLNSEVTHLVNGLKRNSMTTDWIPKSDLFIPTGRVDVPDKVDWRDKGAVTDVKNQKQCGSCYSFSATGAMEGQHFLKTGKLVSLSEQNIIDCSWGYGNLGCNGGTQEGCYNYTINNKGIDTEESYPYTGCESHNCQFDSNKVGATFSSYKQITSGDEKALKEAVATIGPISVSIDARWQSFQDYQSGVYYEPKCSTTDLDHAVLVVGYGTTDDGKDYWLVKNSWSTIWGDEGYILMSRNKNNNCGIATDATYPIV